MLSLAAFELLKVNIHKHVELDPMNKSLLELNICFYIFPLVIV